MARGRTTSTANTPRRRYTCPRSGTAARRSATTPTRQTARLRGESSERIVLNRAKQDTGVTHQVSDYILFTLILEFHHVACVPCQFCQICSCPSRIGLTSEIQIQSQQNVFAQLTGHPVQYILKLHSIWQSTYRVSHHLFVD